MKAIKYLSIVIAAALLPAFTPYDSINWEIVDGYSIRFTSEVLSGVFNRFYGDIDFDVNNPEQSQVDLIIDVNSIETGNDLMNEHALGDQWFDAEKYPHITFISSSISKTGNGFEVSGKMTVHGVAKEVTIPFNFNNDAFTSSFQVNRGDYHIGSTEGMMSNVPVILQIDVFVPVIRK